MKPIIRSSALALAVSAGWVVPAHAQPADAEAIQQELARMRAQMAAMAERIDDLQGQLSRAEAQAVAASEAAAVASASAAAAKEQPVKIAWKGAPVIEGKGGWSFKPRGRLQYDAGFIDVPASTGRPDGFGSEIRRARLGFEGEVPGGFGYKFEVDFAGNEVEVADAIMTYEDGGLTLSVGQHNPFQSLEELTSSRFTSFMERAAFTDAFGFERRLGVSAQYLSGDVLVQGGIFSDNIDDLSNKSWSVDGRAVYMPEMGGTQLHFGGSVHYSEPDEAAPDVRYRQRPFVHFTDQRFVDTGSFAAESELGFGIEAAAIAGRLHLASEGFWQRVNRTSMLADPTFFGGYVEVGYFLTAGDSRGYKNGTFDRVKPARPVGEGGIGAVQLNVRYDRLDLSDAGLIGGTQNGYALSVIWTPTDYTRLMLNYGRTAYRNAIHPASLGDRSYSVDALAMRAQIDF